MLHQMQFDCIVPNQILKICHSHKTQLSRWSYLFVR